MNQETLFGGGEPLPPRKPRARDELFDALAFVCAIKPDELTTSGRGQLNRALKEIRDTGATPPDVVLRALAYAERFKQTPTPGALARHWASLSTRPQAVERAPAPAQPEARYVDREELARLAHEWREEHPLE